MNQDYQLAGKLIEFENGEARVCLMPGLGAVAVVKIGAKFHAFSNYCTHEGSNLANGYGDLMGKVMTCLAHNASYDVEDGHVIGGPASDPLTIYQVHIQGDDVLVGKA